ncbi:MerR family DNA-binding transcriptional regulator [Croceicoccus ponticola]|uniref:MerR family DNA-binding transcriptional regulator n=1 Tax=Croceicoccus ponticola TaxID=2217664 RepID=A0A437H2A2_9SPHN|nr:MerR family DNA-binding transcriptional regulator [Croceicoccus ponticola]
MTEATANARDDWTIAELSAEFGVTPRALRFYEERGLISPRRVGTQRVYTERDRARLHWIERAKSVGFSLTEVGEMLDLYDLDDGRHMQRRVTIERCREQLAKLERQQKDIVWAIGVLKDFIPEVEAGLSPKVGED